MSMRCSALASREAEPCPEAVCQSTRATQQKGAVGLSLQASAICASSTPSIWACISASVSSPNHWYSSYDRHSDTSSGSRSSSSSTTRRPHRLEWRVLDLCVVQQSARRRSGWPVGCAPSEPERRSGIRTRTAETAAARTLLEAKKARSRIPQRDLELRYAPVLGGCALGTDDLARLEHSLGRTREVRPILPPDDQGHSLGAWVSVAEVDERGSPSCARGVVDTGNTRLDSDRWFVK